MRVVNHINGDPRDNALETLEPCVCGRAPECVSGPNLCQVVCRSCGRGGPVMESEWLAVNLWNNDHRLKEFMADLYICSHGQTYPCSACGGEDFAARFTEELQSPLTATVETLTAERNAWRRGAMLLLDELGDYESGCAPHIRVRRLRMKLKSISDTSGGLQMLLRSWLACMQEPRPKDWQEIAVNLITDSRKFLDEKTDAPDDGLIDRVLQIMGNPGITETTYAKLKVVLAGKKAYTPLA